jgi:NADPH:quinone reductase
MRAVLVTEFGPVSGLTIGEVDDLVPGPGQVVVEVAAASVNFPDILVVEGTYQHLPRTPFSPGKEAAGRILAIGADVDGLVVGQRVLALTEYGAYAEQLLIDAALVTPIPDGISDEDAAAMGLVFLTAHMGLVRRGRLQAGETVLVTGAGGGVGAAGVQLARAFGARVVALVHDSARADAARANGADVVLQSSAATLRDDVLTATDGHGADLVLEMLGGDYLTQAVRATAWEGRIVIVGFAVGSQNPVKPGHLLVKNIGLLGLQASDYRDRTPALMRSTMTEVFALAAAGRIRAGVDRVLPLEHAADALQQVKDRQVRGKIVLRVSRDVQSA